MDKAGCRLTQVAGCRLTQHTMCWYAGSMGKGKGKRKDRTGEGRADGSKPDLRLGGEQSLTAEPDCEVLTCDICKMT